MRRGMEKIRPYKYLQFSAWPVFWIVVMNVVVVPYISPPN